MKTVAVTGGIGSGKTAVCEILARRGIPVYDSDSGAKSLYAKDDDLLDSVEEAFGFGFRLQDGSPDLDKLASVVFASPDKLKTLESIVHPAVLKDFIRWRAMEDSRYEGSEASDNFFGKKPFVVIESAIILDKPEFLAFVDRVVLVDAPLAVRLQRACDRDDVSAEKIIQRMSRQHFDVSKVDAMIRNDGTFEKLKTEVASVFRKLVL